MRADRYGVSRLYVGLQFGLIGLIAWPFAPPVAGAAAILCFSAGLAVFASALAAMRRDTFSVMPEPRPSGELITGGVYRFVRHPMYLAVLLCAIGACLAYGSAWKWGVTALLAAVLLLKSRREERLLATRYAGYAEYRRRTRAILPFLF